MNFFIILLSIFFSAVAPSNYNNEGSGSGNNNGTTQTEPGGTKKDKSGDADFIISLDGNP